MELLARVRWGNVGRLAALLAAGVLAIGGVGECGGREPDVRGAGRAGVERLPAVPAPRRLRPVVAGREAGKAAKRGSPRRGASSRRGGDRDERGGERGPRSARVERRSGGAAEGGAPAGIGEPPVLPQPARPVEPAPRQGLPPAPPQAPEFAPG